MPRASEAPSSMSRALQGTGQVVLTLAVLGMSAAAAVLGANALADRADAAPTPDAAEPMSVATRELVMEDGYTAVRTFVGQVEPAEAVDVSFELAGRLEVVNVDEGAVVRKGDILARLDTRLLEAELARLRASRAALEAQLTFAEGSAARRGDLNDRGFASAERLEAAIATRDELAARIAELDAALLEAGLRLDKASVSSPIDGRVTIRHVDGGAALSPGQPVLSLVSDGDPMVRVGVPLDIAAGLGESATISVNGDEYQARLISLRPDVDPVTRTRTALFSIPGAANGVYGQTARLRIEGRIEVPGTWVPLRSLKENAGGLWTILTLDDEGLVRLSAVEVLHVSDDRVFVRGSFPEGTRAIDAGPQRLVPGQSVRVTDDGI